MVLEKKKKKTNQQPFPMKMEWLSLLVIFFFVLCLGFCCGLEKVLGPQTFSWGKHFAKRCCKLFICLHLSCSALSMHRSWSLSLDWFDCPCLINHHFLVLTFILVGSNTCTPRGRRAVLQQGREQTCVLQHLGYFSSFRTAYRYCYTDSPACPSVRTRGVLLEMVFLF